MKSFFTKFNLWLTDCLVPNIRNTVKVACLTSAKNDEAMWEKYAEDPDLSGIMIEYQVLNEGDSTLREKYGLSGPIKVEYCNDGDSPLINVRVGTDFSINIDDDNDIKKY